MTAERCTQYCARRGCPRRAVQRTREGWRCKKCSDRMPPHMRRLDARRKPTPPADHPEDI